MWATGFMRSLRCKVVPSMKAKCVYRCTLHQQTLDKREFGPANSITCFTSIWASRLEYSVGVHANTPLRPLDKQAQLHKCPNVCCESTLARQSAVSFPD